MKVTWLTAGGGSALLLLLSVCGCRHSGDSARSADVQVQGADVTTASDVRITVTRYLRLDRQANVFTSSGQDAAALDQDRFGHTVVVWESRRQERGTYGIYARRFDSSGTAVGDEVHINGYTASMQTRPAVSYDGTGAVWFGWVSYGQDGDRGAIIARRFDASLSSATPEVLVNEVTGGDQSEVAIVGCLDGSAVAVWTSPDSLDANRGVYARVIGRDGRVAGHSVRVNTRGQALNHVPSVVEVANGFVVVWARTDRRGARSEIVGRRLDSAGRPTGGEFALSKSNEAMQIEPAVAVTHDGNLLAGWLVADGEDYAIETRLFSPDGRALTPAQRVTPSADLATMGLALSAADNGQYVLCWSTYDSVHADTSLYAEVFDRTGRPMGEPFRVTDASAGVQRLQAATGAKRVGMSADGRMVFAWSGRTRNGDHSGANVTFLTPVGLGGVSDSPSTQVVEAVDTFAPIDAEASPYLPPTFDANRMSSNRPAIAAAEQGTANGFGFLGIDSTGWDPADPTIAVGASHVVVVTNGEIAIYTKEGVLTFRDRLENSGGFWGELGATNMVFDPEVIYDPNSGRFMVMANERTDPAGITGRSLFVLAVSDDSDPNGTWHKFRIDVTAMAGATVIDSPNIGVDADVVYLTADFLGPPRHLIVMLEKAPLLTGSIGVMTHLVINPEAQSYGIPVILGAAGAMYLLEAADGFVNTSVQIHAIRDPLGTPTLETVIVPTPEYRRPEQPPQLGTSARLLTFDSRFWSCVYRNGSLWATHHVTRSLADPRVIQRWYEFDLNGWPANGAGLPTIAQWGDVDPGPGVRTYFGAIGVDPQNNMGMVFSRSSPNEYISIGRTGRLATDPPGATRPMVIVKQSTSPTVASPSRWGDYGGIAVDPVDDQTFWIHHQYRTFNWLTWVGTFSYSDTTPPTIVSEDPFNGYIDPRLESSNGVSLDRGISHVTLTFSERVVTAGGTAISASAFSISATGGVNPGIAWIDASANPTIEIELGGVIPVGERTTITTRVEDLSGNLAVSQVTYGFLPGDVSQDAIVSPQDLVRFRQFLAGVMLPPAGGVSLFLDMDRDGQIVPQDLTRFRQTIHGTGLATRPWNGETLP